MKRSWCEHEFHGAEAGLAERREFGLGKSGHLADKRQDNAR